MAFSRRVLLVQTTARRSNASATATSNGYTAALPRRSRGRGMRAICSSDRVGKVWSVRAYGAEQYLQRLPKTPYRRQGNTHATGRTRAGWSSASRRALTRQLQPMGRLGDRLPGHEPAEGLPLRSCLRRRILDPGTPTSNDLAVYGVVYRVAYGVVFVKTAARA